MVQRLFCPPEWNALTMKTRAKLTNLLSWDSMSLWYFSIVDVSELASVDRIAPPIVGGIAPVIDDGLRARGEAVVGHARQQRRRFLAQPFSLANTPPVLQCLHEVRRQGSACRPVLLLAVLNNET
jgi:hypothetical protein